MGGGQQVRTQATTGGAAARPDWLACLQEVCELLWPPPTVVALEDNGPALLGLSGGRRRTKAGGTGDTAVSRPEDREFALVAGIHRPPLMVPAERRPAAAAVRHHSRPRSAAARMGVKALCVGLSTGLGGAALRGRVRISAPAGADTIEEHLKTVLSQDLTVSMYLGPARANRKPVLQLLAHGGEPAGFAKIGVNPLTRSLVRTEHASLLQLARAGLTQITVPRVLHYDSWHGLEVLVLSALPAWLPPRRLPPPRLVAAMTELAGVGGLRQEPLATGRYLHQLRTRLAATDRGPEQTALWNALGVVTEASGQEVLTYGSWHGDWSPWNMAHTSDGLLVWDWERFAAGVPLGFDALHHRLQTEVAMPRSDPRAAAAACLGQAASHLAPFGLNPPQAHVTAILYLTDLATRYLTDRQAQAGAPLGAPRTWLIPAITRATSVL
jgi:Phosphotransferase enzyme family